ncbi:MAG: tRNA (adenosine(37)-N6)-threonylcarbamoyltransferase complex dimerization subunit type 1 TsaB, partial [Eubacteriales bacterium]
CVGVSTLGALAYNLLPLCSGCDDVICPVMDARRSQVYNAVWRGGKRLCADRLITLDTLGQELSELPENVKIHFCGDGARLAMSKIELPNISETPDNLIWQNGYSVARAALDKYRAEGAMTGEQLAPIYLRASQAERERTAGKN